MYRLHRQHCEICYQVLVQVAHCDQLFIFRRKFKIQVAFATVYSQYRALTITHLSGCVGVSGH